MPHDLRARREVPSSLHTIMIMCERFKSPLFDRPDRSLATASAQQPRRTERYIDHHPDVDVAAVKAARPDSAPQAV